MGSIYSDITIIGVSAIGSPTAYYLKKMNHNFKTLLIDKNSRTGGSNTGKSAALYWNIVTSKNSILITESSIKFYHPIKEQTKLR